MASPTIESARNSVRHQIRDGLPALDATPVPFNTVRLEELTDQLPGEATPTLKQFQLRFQNVPTEQYMSVTAVPKTLVAFVDGSWTPTKPTVDVDSNGVFTLPVAPVSKLLVSYAWQYLSDGEIDAFVDQARQWLREFGEVSQVPDGLSHALTHYASALALRALERSATIADLKAGDTESGFSSLSKSYERQATSLEARAETEREQYYSRGPEKLEPAVDVGSLRIDGYQPLR